MWLWLQKYDQGEYGYWKLIPDPVSKVIALACNAPWVWLKVDTSAAHPPYPRGEDTCGRTPRISPLDIRSRMATRAAVEAKQRSSSSAATNEDAEVQMGLGAARSWCELDFQPGVGKFHLGFA